MFVPDPLALRCGLQSRLAPRCAMSMVLTTQPSSDDTYVSLVPATLNPDAAAAAHTAAVQRHTELQRVSLSRSCSALPAGALRAAAASAGSFAGEGGSRSASVGAADLCEGDEDVYVMANTQSGSASPLPPPRPLPRPDDARGSPSALSRSPSSLSRSPMPLPRPSTSEPVFASDPPTPASATSAALAAGDGALRLQLVHQNSLNMLQQALEEVCV
jgi:hypothetical protein